MDIPESIVRHGLDQAWSALSRLAPEEVCRRSGAAWEPDCRRYRLPCFGQPIAVCPEEKTLDASTETGRVLVFDLSELFCLAAVWYLVQAKDAACSGRLVRPSELPGGDMFNRGTHILPLDRLAARFGRDPDALRVAGGGLATSFPDLGDAALKLLPFPRLPVTVVLWAADEEFPARASLLLDSTAGLHLPTDVLWSTCLLSLLLLLRREGPAARRSPGAGHRPK